MDPQPKDPNDRREVDPPIQVDAATWSSGGQLDWWVKERQEWWGRVRGPDGRQGGSELLIFVAPRACDRGFSRFNLISARGLIAR